MWELEAKPGSYTEKNVLKKSQLEYLKVSEIISVNLKAYLQN